MNNISVFEKCSNCGACYNACPSNAIWVNKDALFYNPVVDSTKCLNCGLCQKVCPVNAPQKAQSPIRAYAAIHNDNKIVQSSSSGGIFRALADLISVRGGVVFGAAYTDKFRTVHICSDEQVPMESLQKSKYVESLPSHSFRRVREYLENGQAVLYCGAPCQIAGLKRFLGKDYDSLLTCDFSCGGMPSHKLYQQWLAWVEKKLKAPVAGVDFRPKTFGWNPHAVKVHGKNGRVYCRLFTEDSFFDCFVSKHLTIRDYCLECGFANNHFSDIILADFWKHKSISNVSNGNKGISLLIANTEKGERAIAAISGQVALTTLTLENASYNLNGKSVDAEFRKERDEFLRRCESSGFIAAAGPRKRNCKFRIKHSIKKLLGRDKIV